VERGLKHPKWLQITDELLVGLLRTVHSTLESNPSVKDHHLTVIPQLAVFHLSACLHSSMDANENGLHSAAVCLVRQCVEALTVIELGMQPPAFKDCLLQEWDNGKHSHGELRRLLEDHVWPTYGKGLWGEPWAEFFGNFARAVQPYAHYTPQLMNWQMAVDWHNSSGQMLVRVGPTAYDPIKASRITLLHSLTTWVLARTLLENSSPGDHPEMRRVVEELGLALGRSKLLFKSKDWAAEIAPHVLFREGRGWQNK
jgi:hypothetical protein